MTEPGTSLPSLTGAQFASRIADLFPRGWASDDAKQSGNVYALLLSVGNEMQIVQQEVQYALSAQRLQTETFPELDFASIDFLGETSPRSPGETDSDFSQQIIAALFQTAATRSAIQNGLIALTGSQPRMMEPWSVADTGAWGVRSYWNVDTVANPARWGNGGLRYQGFIETAPAAIPAIGPDNPILCWGANAYWNVPGYFFGIIALVDENAVNDTVNRLRAYGTLIWLKLVASSSLPTSISPSAVTALAAAPAGPNSIAVSWQSPVTGSPPFTYLVLFRQSGTTAFLTGPTTGSATVTVPNLAPGTSYDFQVVVRNVAGSATSGFVTAATGLVPPAPAQNLVALQVQATAITVAWQQPTTGTPPFTYLIMYRVTGTTFWQTLPVGLGSLTVTIINLIPHTSYDIEVQTTN